MAITTQTRRIAHVSLKLCLPLQALRTTQRKERNHEGHEEHNDGDQRAFELKRIEELRGIHDAQLLTCRKLAGMKIGLLINFNVKKLKDSTKYSILRFLRALRALRGEKMHGAPRAERKAVEQPWPTNASAFATQSVENNVTERAQPRRTRRWSSTSFRIAKDERAIRPIWYHKEDSVKAHLLVCVLACELWRTLSGWMTNSGVGCAPRTLLEEMAKLKSGPITLAANRPNEAQPRQINLGCSAGPAEAQNVLLHRPGLNLARRLQRLDHPVQMQ